MTVVETVAKLRALAERLALLSSANGAGRWRAVDETALQQAELIANLLEVTDAYAKERGEPLPWVFPGTRDVTPRVHRGMSPNDAFEELVGNRKPQHKAWNTVPATTRSGGHLTQAVGFAKAQQQQAQPGRVLAFLQDGDISAPDFHEALNFAGVWQAPVTFVVLGEGGQAAVDAAAGYGLSGHATNAAARAQEDAWAKLQHEPGLWWLKGSIFCVGWLDVSDPGMRCFALRD